MLARSKSATAERSDPAATASHAKNVRQWREQRDAKRQAGEIDTQHTYTGSRGGAGFRVRCAPVLTKDSPVVIEARKLLAPRDGTASREEIEAGRVAAFDHVLAHLAKVGDMPRSWEELVASQSSGPGRIGVNNLAWLLELTEADDGDLDDGAIDVADLEGGVSRAEPIAPVHEFAVVTGSLSKPSASDDVGSAEGLRVSVGGDSGKRKLTTVELDASAAAIAALPPRKLPPTQLAPMAPPPTMAPPPPPRTPARKGSAKGRAAVTQRVQPKHGGLRKSSKRTVGAVICRHAGQDARFIDAMCVKYKLPRPAHVDVHASIAVALGRQAGGHRKLGQDKNDGLQTNMTALAYIINLHFKHLAEADCRYQIKVWRPLLVALRKYYRGQ